MPELLWECWREDAADGSFEFFVFVSEDGDKNIDIICPTATRTMSIYALSNIEAFKTYQNRSVGEDWEPPGEMEVYIYTDADSAEQAAYLKRRIVR